MQLLIGAVLAVLFIAGVIISCNPERFPEIHSRVREFYQNMREHR
jgi:hypothetical protein